MWSRKESILKIWNETSTGSLFASYIAVDEGMQFLLLKLTKLIKIFLSNVIE
jgi:hypothetical protein